jgi:hypothetical protein
MMSKYAAVSKKDLELIRSVAADCAAILTPPITKNEIEVQTRANKALRVFNAAIKRASEPNIFGKRHWPKETNMMCFRKPIADNQVPLIPCPTGEES